VSLLARYAENLFWLARYVERASSLARIIEIHMSFDRARDDDISWAWLVALHADQDRFAESYGEYSFLNVMKFYVADLNNSGSILFALRAARENARALRAVISTEMWIQLNEFHNRFLGFSDTDLDPIRLSRTCGQIKSGCYAQIGVVESTLYRDEGWGFFRLGLMIERADQTSRLLDVKFAQIATDAELAGRVADATFWSLILRSAAAYQAYHRREHRGADANRVARFLLLNPSHPRSVSHCVGQIQSALGELRAGFGLRRVSDGQERAEILTETLQSASANPNLARDLHRVNDELQRNLIGLTNSLGSTFFGYPEPSQQSQTQTQS
jgi:uncharacterized alpha-E superfamily protein